MTHAAESTIEPLVADWFRERYGDDRVATQVWQPEPRWYCDIVVDVGFATLFIEVENDADAVRPGIAQALGYAAARPDGVPVVVTPVDHLDEDRAERLRHGGSALVLEFDDEAGTFARTATGG